MAEMSWAQLQKIALDDAHPAWFGEWDHTLINEARQHASGRRLLARALAANAAPVLFGSLPAVIPHAVSGSAWMMLPGERLSALALDLGALSFAETIRLCIDRESVMRLRRVLGAQRYAQVLARARLDSPHSSEMQSQLERVLGDDASLATAIHQRGLAEWMAFAASVHPAAVERLRLCAAPGEATATGQPWLTMQSITRHLAFATEMQREAAND